MPITFLPPIPESFQVVETKDHLPPYHENEDDVTLYDLHTVLEKKIETEKIE